jgi:hypothetical protein
VAVSCVALIAGLSHLGPGKHIGCRSRRHTGRRRNHPQAAPAADAETRPADFPANLRWDLVPKWIKWVADKAQISWPPNDGCAAAPVAQSLTAGQMIDRFGSEFGAFFSPKGESFRSRAVPYVCRQMDYCPARMNSSMTGNSTDTPYHAHSQISCRCVRDRMRVGSCR